MTKYRVISHIGLDGAGFDWMLLSIDDEQLYGMRKRTGEYTFHDLTGAQIALPYNDRLRLEVAMASHLAIGSYHVSGERPDVDCPTCN